MICVHCPLVHSVSLKQCPLITVASWSTLAKTYGPQLVRLDCDGCLTLTDAAFSEVLIFCGAGLTRLSVSGCTLLTDASLASIPTICLKMRHLDLSFLPLLSMSSVLAIIEAFPTQLTHLLVEGCPLITNSILTEIAIKSCCLRVLNIRKCEQMSDVSAAVMRLVRYGRSDLECVYYEDRGVYSA
jgi:EIN3-binding F-box protein